VTLGPQVALNYSGAPLHTFSGNWAVRDVTNTVADQRLEFNILNNYDLGGVGRYSTNLGGVRLSINSRSSDSVSCFTVVTQLSGAALSGGAANIILAGTQAGAWTLGPSGGANHFYNGTLTSGTTSPDGAARMHLFVGGSPATTTNALKISTNNQNTNQQFIRFQTNSSASNGGLERNGGNGIQFYSGASDRRVKNITGMMDPVLEKMCHVAIKKWTYKDTGEEGCSPIAQEIFEIFPEKVITTDNGDGEEVPEGTEPWALRLGYDWYFMKAIQELNAKIEAQAARILELESAP
jgi:hypothetical protein